MLSIVNICLSLKKKQINNKLSQENWKYNNNDNGKG